MEGLHLSSNHSLGLIFLPLTFQIGADINFLQDLKNWFEKPGTILQCWILKKILLKLLTMVRQIILPGLLKQENSSENF